VTRYALNCFGGAGGQHACLVADALGMTTVLIHPFSSLLSAYGMGLADIRATRQQAIEEPFGDAALAAIAAVGARLGEEARDEVIGQGVAPTDISVHVRAHIRYAGTDTALEVSAATLSSPLPTGERSAAQRSGEGELGPTAKSPLTPTLSPTGRGSIRLPSLADMKSAFEAAHKARFGFIDEAKQLVVEAASVEAVGGGAKFAEPLHAKTDAPPAHARSSQPLLFHGPLAGRVGL
jgi:5-oxoprolinase (ATP-hydrolysing)